MECNDGRDELFAPHCWCNHGVDCITGIGSTYPLAGKQSVQNAGDLLNADVSISSTDNLFFDSGF